MPGTSETIDTSQEQAEHLQRPDTAAKAAPPRNDFGDSVLAMEGWLEFNRVRLNLQPLRLRFADDGVDLPWAEAVLYLDQSGQVCHPPRNPYLPIWFQPTNTERRQRITRQWVDLASRLAAELHRRGVKNTLNLSPDIVDVRPWQWEGFRVGVRYTYMIDLPFSFEPADKAVGAKVRKAEKTGFRCDRTLKMLDVMTCLRETEERQDFSYGLTTAELELASQLLGEDHFRAYACYAPDGQLASAQIVLHKPGTPAIGWVAGARTDYLTGGPNQLLESFVIRDLEAIGASGYDLSGANIPTVSAAKAAWGGRLLPYYTVESYSARRLARWTINWWKYRYPGRSR